MNEPFHVLEWRGEDEQDFEGEFSVTGYGRQQSGETTSVRFFHLPTFLLGVKTPTADDRGALSRALDGVRDIIGDRLHPSSQVVRGKPFTGWQPEEQYFLRLVFYKHSKMRAVGKLFQLEEVSKYIYDKVPNWMHRGRFDFDTYECDADPVLQALTSLGIPPTGWVRVESAPSSRAPTKCVKHYEGVPVALSDEEAPPGCAPHVVATFDIEALAFRSTWESQVFPDASVTEDAVTQVCTFFSRFGEAKPYDAEALVLLPPGGKCPEVSEVSSIIPVRVRYFTTEKTLLCAWVLSYEAHKVSVWCHFNGLGFDEAYLHARCALWSVDMSRQSFACGGDAPQLQESKLETNAYGANKFQTVSLAGVFHLDVMQDVKKNHNLESYSLDSCAETFVPNAGSKTGLKPQEQFDCFRSGRAEDIEMLTVYCCQDVALTYQLMERLAMLPSMIETAAVSWVTPTFLVTGGQQIRVYSCIKREIYARGAAFFLRDTKLDPPAEGGYKGATVLEPKRAPWFYPNAIISLDFASLYPSIMVQYNLSHETWTSSADPNDDRFYHHEEGCSFLRATHGQGILPAILLKLKSSRKMYKRSMAVHEKKAHEALDGKEKMHHAFMEKVFDAKQKATKVTMNSVYGFCGVGKFGRQPCLPLASATTTIGRQLIDKTVVFCEAHIAGSEVIYGDTDSVMWNIWPDRKVDSATIADAFKAADEACRAIAPIFAHDGSEAIILEFENVYANYLLLGKKLYATLQYSADLGPEKPKKTVMKGLRCVRRDTIALASKSQAACVTSITNNRVAEALDEGRRVVKALFNGEVRLDQLMTSKKISSSYVVTARPISGEKIKVDVTPHGIWQSHADPGVKGTCEIEPGMPWKMLDAAGRRFGELTLAQPHVHVMHRVEARSRGSGPRVGDRVRYVFVEDKSQTSDLQIARAEDPVWAQEKGMTPDVVYYFEHSVKPPLEAVLGLFAKDKGCGAELGWSLELLRAKNKAEGQNALSAFGFGVANPVTKASRVSKVSKASKAPKSSGNPHKKAKIALEGAAAPGVGIKSFFARTPKQ